MKTSKIIFRRRYIHELKDILYTDLHYKTIACYWRHVKETGNALPIYTTTILHHMWQKKSLEHIL